MYYFNIVCSKGLTGSYTKLRTLINPGRSFCKNVIPIAKQSLLNLKTGGVCRRFTDLLDKPNGLCPNTINIRDNACIVQEGRILPPGRIPPLLPYKKMNFKY